MKLIPVAPVTVNKSIAHINRGDEPHTFEVVDSPVYPPEHVRRGKAIRSLREQADISMGELADAAHLTVVEVSGIEHGKFTMSGFDFKKLEILIDRMGKSKQRARQR